MSQQDEEGGVAPVDLGDIEQYETAEEAQRAAEEAQRADAASGSGDASDPGADAAAGPTAEEYAALKAERNRLYEAWLRTSADFDNYRKRTEREREEFRRHAIESLFLQMLPVLDNFERALGSLPADIPRGFLEGVTLIYKQLQDVLAKQGLTPLATEGQMFDPHLHEAVETEAADLPHHQILGEVQKGYRLGKRVLRPALVRVCVHPEEEVDIQVDDEAESGGDAS